MSRKGKLYGVGTGPGDPELLTLKALRIIREADVIAVPNEDPPNAIPYKTIAAVYPEIASKEILAVPFLMKPDHAARQAVREENAEKIAAVLDQGRDVAFLTMGDPSIYTTYGYVFALLAPHGYDCEMISGVPSFCGASARLNVTLCSDQEKLEIIPGGMRSPVTAALLNPEVSDPESAEPASDPSVGRPGCGTGATQVYMKFETLFPRLIETLNHRGEAPMVIENCCLENERAFRETSSLPEDIGYFNIVISHNDGRK